MENEQRTAILKESPDPFAKTNSYSPPRSAPPTVRIQRIILVCAILLGIVFDRAIAALPYQGAISAGYAIFWLCYLPIGIGITWKTGARRLLAWVLAALAALLCISNLLRDAEPMRLWNLVVIPAVLMMHAQIAAAKQDETDWILAIRWLEGFFAWPLMHIPRIFVTIHGLFFSKKARRNQAFKGLAIAVPILALVTALLFSADAVLAYWASQWLQYFRLDEVLQHTLIMLLVVVLFGSFLYSASIDESHLAPRTAKRIWESATVGMVLGLLCVVYALFCGVQFVYLFGGAGLPGDLTYADYARKGFFELITVAGINLVIFFACLFKAKESRGVRALLAALAALTLVMVCSGLKRLAMYIEAYGLTWQRVFSFTFMLALALTFMACITRLFAYRLPLVRVSLGLVAVWYACLALGNVEAVMVRWNLMHMDEQVQAIREDQHLGRFGEYLSDTAIVKQRMAYLGSLSSDAVPALATYFSQEDSVLEREQFFKMKQQLLKEGCWNLSDTRAKAALDPLGLE